MARGSQSTHHDTLDELNSIADHLRDWIALHPIAVLVGAAVVLVLAGGYGGWAGLRGRSEDRASAAFAAVERDYLKAMGATPGSVEIVEPANPETAKSVRRDFSEKFLAVAKENAGSKAAWSARVSAGDLLLAAGESERAIEVWNETLGGLGASDPARGVVLQRLASAQESLGHWKEAAEAWKEAAALPDHPLGPLAGAQAARCFREAGDLAAAREAARNVPLDPGPTSVLPAHLQALVTELKAADAPPAPSAGAAASQAPAPADAASKTP